MSLTGGGLLQSGRTQPPAPEINVPQVAANSRPREVADAGQAQVAPVGGVEGVEGVNRVSDLSLRMLHDENIGPEFQKLIAQGPEAAAQVAVQIYDKIVQGFSQHGEPIDDAQGAEAAEIVMDDISEMGVAMTQQQQGQGFEMEPSSGGEPLSVQKFKSITLDMLAQKYPDIGATAQQIAAEPVTPEEQAQADQLGQYMMGAGGAAMG